MNEGKSDSVTKAVLADAVTNSLPSTTNKKASAIVESIFDCICDTLVKNEEVKISGFGKFTTHEKKARKGRNPKTGEPITISDRRVLKFKASDCLRAEMNGVTFDGED